MNQNNLPKRTYLLLKRIGKTPLNQRTLLKSEENSFYLLLKLGYIYCSNPIDGYNDDEPVGGYIYKITLNGEAYLEFYKANKREHLISRIISFISLTGTIANIIALILKS